MSASSLRAVVFGVVLTLGVAGGFLFVGLQEPASPPTEAQARATLDRAVELARSGDFAGLCAIGDGNCERTLVEAGEDAVPALPPTVVGTRVIEPRRVGWGRWELGGRVLDVCGTDGRGQPYRTEVLVFQDGHAMRIINAVYWSRLAIATSDTSATSPMPIAGCPSS